MTGILKRLHLLGYALACAVAVFAAPVAAQPAPRTPAGTLVTPADVMRFYVARGPAGMCGPGCTEWIAAEGIAQWDTNKRLTALLDKLAGRKLPVVVDAFVGSDRRAATILGRIIRARGLDTTAGRTLVAQCDGKADADCLALKRGGSPLEAQIDRSKVQCENACVLMLAGGTNRTLPAQALLVLTGAGVENRLAPNLSQEHRDGLRGHFIDQYRRYVADMGLSAEIADIVERNTQNKSFTRLNPDDWVRLRIVTAPPQ